MEQCVMNADTGIVTASGAVIAVTFDYEGLKTISVPDEWKKKISQFENI
jgi:acyl-CoA thioesterase FadM